MFIILGERERNIEQSRDELYCPNCNATRAFKRMRIGSYFTLFFIPLFETRRIKDYVECLHCKLQFNPDAVNSDPPSLAYRAVTAARSDLESGTAVEQVIDKLAKAMTTRELAKQFVDSAAGAARRKCKACNLTYILIVENCNCCERQLAAE
ncbi:zinc-ribbon domain-containing protein [Limnoglobus roseus]|uniref:Zinc-ribbon domain-containing protein n=1 Tax=Limnoglobus roseus TaxID=2598579 RepID=A0A5C1AQ98_9BACT|nr:zinc-ribbon domain-containing protein [Limnoglobus roseus]QEL20206.1 zinc-ribbon domain-containing protein [Limnoglobus roseus]